MSDVVNLKRKRLIYAEDLDFDASGANNKVEITSGLGSKFNVSKINAKHIPITKKNRALLNVNNVDEAINVLASGNSFLGSSNSNGNNNTTATEINAGVARLATKTEVMNGTSDDTIVTPRRLHDLKASSTQLGIVELASSDDVINGTRPNAVIPVSLLNMLGALPIGVGPLSWYWGAPPEGWIVANGGLYSRSAHPKFWELIRNFTVTDAEWENNTASFSSGDGGSTFRMPNLTVLNMGGGEGLKPNLINVVYIFKGR